LLQCYNVKHLSAKHGIELLKSIIINFFVSLSDKAKLLGIHLWASILILVMYGNSRLHKLDHSINTLGTLLFAYSSLLLECNFLVLLLLYDMLLQIIACGLIHIELHNPQNKQHKNYKSLVQTRPVWKLAPKLRDHYTIL
jgi:hypothetical protein